MKPNLAIFLLVLLSLSGCNLPRVTPTPNPALVATQVAQMLTILPATATSTPPVSDTATQPPTQSPQPSPTPTGTPSPGDPRQILGAPTWTDQFNDGKHFGEFDDDHARVEMRDGHLFLTAHNADSWYSWTIANANLKDFYLEATVKTSDCAGLDRYGLMARAPDPSQGYFLDFSCDGQYQLRIWDGNKFTGLIPWTRSDHINAGAGQINRIGLMARGAQLSLYANGALLKQLQDSTYAEGTFGLFIAAAKTAGFTVEVDEVDYWKLP